MQLMLTRLSPAPCTVETVSKAHQGSGEGNRATLSKTDAKPVHANHSRKAQTTPQQQRLRERTDETARLAKGHEHTCHMLQLYQ